MMAARKREDAAPNLTVAECVLLFRIASSTEWQKVGITGEAAQSEPCYHLLPVHTVPCYLTRKWRIWRRISESCFRGRLRQTTYKPLISNGPCAGVNRVLPGTSGVAGCGATCEAGGAAGGDSAGGGATEAGAGDVSCEAP
jgi:hypothetical protein